MKFRIDNALSPKLATLLTAAGHEAVHVRTYGMHAAKDEEILARALKEDRIVVSADSDFATLLALQEASSPSLISFEAPTLLLAQNYVEILLSAFATLDPELISGCVAAFRKHRLRVHKLPFQPEFAVGGRAGN